MDKSYKKQLRAQFLEKKPLMGVLTILNKVDNKLYIAESMNLTALSNKIQFILNSGQFDHKILQEDWNRLEKDNFVFENAVVIPLEENKMIDYKKQILKARNDLKEELSKTIHLY
jgi:hypothetical protein